MLKLERGKAMAELKEYLKEDAKSDIEDVIPLYLDLGDMRTTNYIILIIQVLNEQEKRLKELEEHWDNLENNLDEKVRELTGKTIDELVSEGGI